MNDHRRIEDAALNLQEQRLRIENERAENISRSVALAAEGLQAGMTIRGARGIARGELADASAVAADRREALAEREKFAQ